MDGWDGRMRWREILKKKEWQTSRIRKERNDTKRRSYRGWVLFGGKGKKEVTWGETTIYVYLETVKYQPLILEYCLCAEDIETQDGNPRLDPIEKENAKLQFYILISHL